MPNHGDRSFAFRRWRSGKWSRPVVRGDCGLYGYHTFQLQPTLSRADFCFGRRKRVVIWRGQQKLVVAAATRPIRYQGNRSAAEGNFLPHERDLQAELTRSAIYLPSAAFEGSDLAFRGAEFEEELLLVGRRADLHE